MMTLLNQPFTLSIYAAERKEKKSGGQWDFFLFRVSNHLAARSCFDVSPSVQQIFNENPHCWLRWLRHYKIAFIIITHPSSLSRAQYYY